MQFNTLNLSITIIIIIITVGISLGGFSSQKIMDDLIFYPPAITKRKQWYRFITCGFIHADVMHLLFNMYAFYTFGSAVEIYFGQLFGTNGKLLYIVLYISALVVALLPTYFKNVDNYYYKSLGASGAVAAVVFTYIMLQPMQPLGLIIIPGIHIPAFAFAVIYLAVSAYLDKRGGGGINHSAHLWGSLYGVVFIIITTYFLTKYPLLKNFILHVQQWFTSNFGR
jgi:membrane associated rhomboid family serine protease